MPTQWRTNSDAYIAFLDVLGFGALVRNNTHQELERIYSKALLEGLSLGLSNGSYMFVENGGEKYLTNDVSSTPVNSLIVSDSIIVWTKDDSADSFRRIVSVVRGIMAHSCFNGLPLRGAIEIGPVSWLEGRYESATFNVQQSVIGIGLCKAHDLEKQQEWSGCVIGEEAIVRFEARSTLPDDEKSGLPAMISTGDLCLFEVPFKNGPRAMHVIDWVNHPEVQARSETVANAFVEHNKLHGIHRLADCPSVKAKIENTLRFVRHVFPDADKEGWAAMWAAINR